MFGVGEKSGNLIDTLIKSSNGQIGLKVIRMHDGLH